MDINATTVLVALLGAGGLGAILREIFLGVGRLSNGVAVKESSRKDDLVAERDRALAREAAAIEREDEERARGDRADRNRWAAEEFSARLQRIVILNGLEHLIPALAVVEDTLSAAEFRKITGGTN